MKLFRLRFCRCDRRKSRIFLLVLVTIFNFAFGLFLISSVVSIADDEKQKLTKEKQINDELIPKDRVNVEKKLKSSYDYYFRIDYTINQGVCKSIDLFNTSINLRSIENFTTIKIRSIFNRNLSGQIDLLSLNANLLKSDKIRQNGLHKYLKTVCDYNLQLYIGLDFQTSCGEKCRVKEISRLTARSKPFEHRIDNSFSFFIYPTSQYESITTFTINQFLLCNNENEILFSFPFPRLDPTTSYLNKPVYIRSFYSIRYISALILDSEGYKSSITMSQIDRSLFLVKDALDKSILEEDSSTIYVSFSSVAAHSTYLRHESSRLKLTKNDQSTLFKQDATFKLLFGKSKKDLIAFESINLPTFFLAVDQETHTALMLVQPQTNHQDIELLEKRFLFKFIPSDQ